MYENELLRRALGLCVFDTNSEDRFVFLPELSIADNGMIGDQETGPRSLLPLDLFPANCRVHLLPDGEPFLEGLRNLIPRENPVRIFLLPPLLGHQRLSKKIQEQSPYYDLYAIVAAETIATVAAGSVVWMMLPMHAIAGKASAGFRRYLLENTDIRLIYCCNHLTTVPTLIPFSGILIEKAPASECTRFFQCPASGDDTQIAVVTSDLSKLLRQKGGLTRYGYAFRGQLSLNRPWIYSIYHPENVNRKEDLASLGGLRRLSDIARIERGFFHKSKATDVASDVVEGSVLLVSAEDIRRGGSIECECENPRYCSGVPADQLLRPGDILVRRVQSERLGRLVCAIVTEDVGAAVASHTVIVVRPSASLSPQERMVLCDYLRSSKYWEILNAEGAVSSMREHILIQPHDLGDLEVPILDEAMALSIDALTVASEQFRRWADELAEARIRLFEHASMRTARTDTLALGRLARQRHEAALLVSDFRHRVRSRYPHPIAFRWRTVESSHPTLEGYLAVIECAEVTVTYLATMAVLLAYFSGVKLRALDTMAARISNTGHGTNLGDWISILQEASGKEFQKAIADDSDFIEITRFYSDERVLESLNRIKARRDDQSHGRGPKKGEICDAFCDAKSALEAILESIEYVSDYPLRMIEITRRDAIHKLTRYSYRELMGDHPLVPVCEASTKNPELEAESLYLYGRTGELHLLRPLLIGRECPVCQTWGTFFLDTCSRRSGKVVLKSMEHGHTFEDADKEVANAFRHLGMLQ